MTKADFQKAHGSAWEQITRHPAFFAAMQVCSSERLREIEHLSPAEIEANGKVHLAGFQGHLKTESILLSLSAEYAPGVGGLPDADYGAPIDGESPFFPVEPIEEPKPKRKKTK